MNSTTQSSQITDQEVHSIQAAWAEGIVQIGDAFSNGGDYHELAATFLKAHYGFEFGPIQFKPTLAREQPFRSDFDSALSYFVTGICAEDTGFAIKPWSAVRFENHSNQHFSDITIAMGVYYFTPAAGGDDVKVEYTFGYKKNSEGRLMVVLHHSSLPAAHD